MKQITGKLRSQALAKLHVSESNVLNDVLARQLGALLTKF